MNRREMLLRAVQAGVILTLPKPLQFFANEKKDAVLTELVGNPLRFPPVFTNGGTMTLAESTVQVWPSQNTQVIAINGSYPAPSIVIQKGQTFTANFVNNVNEPTTVHWHGLSVPELMDGHPKDAVPFGGSKTYTFPVLNRAGTYFYHSHGDMITAKQVYKGFAGFFIVTDPAENFNLPTGNYDIPLCIQDRRTANAPQFTYAPGTNEMMYGYLGDTVLVNGTPEAYFDVGKTLYRFRLLNGSNARVYRLAFADTRPFHIIATDGGLKDSPVVVNQLNLAPGERADILVDFSTDVIGENVSLISLPFSHSGTLPYKQGIELDVIRFVVTNNNTSGGVVPAAFNPITYYDINQAVNTRTFALTMSGSSHPMHKINGLTFDINRIDWEVPLDSLEEWRIINQTADFHPMHAHGLQWQLYSRNGFTNLPPSDKGWKDTINLSPGETVRVLVKFTDYKGIYLFHCHNLEHEDDGMMLNFKVIDPIGIQQISSEVPENFKLHQNYPNPFNPMTKVKFDIPAGMNNNSIIKIYDIHGKEVRTLYSGALKAGSYEFDFDGSNFSSGTYFCRLISGNMSRSIKMMLSK